MVAAHAGLRVEISASVTVIPKTSLAVVVERYVEELIEEGRGLLKVATRVLRPATSVILKLGIAKYVIKL